MLWIFATNTTHKLIISNCIVLYIKNKRKNDKVIHFSPVYRKWARMYEKSILAQYIKNVHECVFFLCKIHSSVLKILVQTVFERLSVYIWYSISIHHTPKYLQITLFFQLYLKLKTLFTYQIKFWISEMYMSSFDSKKLPNTKLEEIFVNIREFPLEKKALAPLSQDQNWGCEILNKSSSPGGVL